MSRSESAAIKFSYSQIQSLSRLILRILAAIALIIGAEATCAYAGKSEVLAPTPPMGWNSWDSYGTTIDEASFKMNADWLATRLKPFGWKYVVVDMEWFVLNPVPEGNASNFEYSIDDYGRYTPPSARFPSSASGRGFQPLADYVHRRGLKFGIHILRGIPRQAVQRNLPIQGSEYHAAEAADRSDTCPWNHDNYGINSQSPAGQAYYDSIARLYAQWGVDFIKVDCISSHPYEGAEIRMISNALRKTGRPVVLSLSPGPAPLDKLDELRQYAQMWRISNDIWDLWHNDQEYPKGLGDQFANVAKWAGVSQIGKWPDADMLPIGYLGPAPGWGKPRESRLTHEEQRTLLTLWCIFRSPLMIGGRLPADEWTTSLLTNPEVIAVDQHSKANRVLSSDDNAVIWSAEQESGGGQYLAIFNMSSETREIEHTFKDLGRGGSRYRIRDLWSRKDLGEVTSIRVTLPSHGCAIYLLSRR